MTKWAVLFAMLAALAFAAGGWAQKKEVQKVPVTPTKPDSGSEMYKSYCAGCHGLAGRGDGPAAEALKVRPADLTMLKQKNGGKFPATKVSQVLDGGDQISAHGSTDMPLWGPIFRSLTPSNDSLAKLRIANL